MRTSTLVMPGASVLEKLMQTPSSRSSPNHLGLIIRLFSMPTTILISIQMLMNGQTEAKIGPWITSSTTACRRAAAAPRRSTCRATTMSTPISAPPLAPTSPATTRTTLCTARRRGATLPAARSSRAPQPRRAAWTTLPSTTPSTTSPATETSRRPSPSRPTAA